jgi:hypothetical protein
LVRGQFAHAIPVERWALREMTVGEGVRQTHHSIYFAPLAKRI